MTLTLIHAQTSEHSLLVGLCTALSFDSRLHRLVSCGRDRKVIIWDCSDVVDGEGEPSIVKECK